MENTSESLSVSIKSSDHLKMFVDTMFGLTSNLSCEKMTIKTLKSRQCIILFGEFVIFCCEIPFWNTKKLTLERFRKDYFILMESSEDFGCCLLSLRSKKLLRYWPGGLEIFIDDYVDIGHDQVIVKFAGEHFHVTDFDCCNFDTNEENVFKSNDAAGDTGKEYETNEMGKMSSVISKTVLNMKKNLDDLNAGIKQQQEIMQHSCDVLIQMTLDCPQSPSNVPCGLVPLIPGKEDVESRFNPLNSNNTSRIHNFKIVNFWYRRVTTQLVIGISIQRMSDVDARYFFVSIMSDCLQATSSSQKVVRFYDGQETRSSGRMFVVATTFPNIRGFQSVQYNVLTHYETSDRKKYVEFIGHISINRTDLIALECVLSQSYLKREEVENTAIESVCCSYKFVLSSKVSSLLSIPEILSKRLNCQCDRIGDVTVLLLKSLHGEVRLQCGLHTATGTIYAITNDFCSSILLEIENILPADVTLDRDISSAVIHDLASKLTSELKSNLKIARDVLKNTEGKELQSDIIVIDPHEDKKQDENEIKKAEHTVFDLEEDTDKLIASLFI